MGNTILLVRFWDLMANITAVESSSGMTGSTTRRVNSWDRMGQYHPSGSFLGQDGRYHQQGAFQGQDGKYHPEECFLGNDGAYHYAGSFLGTDGKYHLQGAFLGTDGQYHPQGSFLGVNGRYEEPEHAAKEERRNQNGVDC